MSSLSLLREVTQLHLFALSLLREVSQLQRQGYASDNLTDCSELRDGEMFV